MTIETERKYEQYQIFFDGLLHLHIKLTDLIGIQSWTYGKSEYSIEYTFTGGTRITSTYISKAIWLGVLKCLKEDSILLQQ